MSVISSSLKTSGAEFKTNSAEFTKLVEELNALRLTAQSPETPIDLQTLKARNKLSVAQRIEHLIDPDSSILEIGPLAGYNIYDGVPPGAGIRTCIATVSGRTCMIVANIPAVKGGTYFPLTVKKHLRAQDIAKENRLPCIYLADSGGAFLPLQDEVFPDRFHFGRIFFNQAQMSREGVPQIAVVLGSCTAGGAYVPAMSDETIMVRGNATVFLGGPPLVKAATGEDVSAEELGGAEVHCSISGVSDHLAEDEYHALYLARQIVGTLKREQAPVGWRRIQRAQASVEPRFPVHELYGVVGTDLKRSFPVLEVLARILDDSRFEEFKAQYGTSIRCGFGHIHGILVGIIANDGILFSEAALKTAHFIQLCDSRGIPLLFLQNIAGFMVGKAYEHEGIAKHGAKMVNAVATARVPKLTLTIGGSFGAGNYSMAGRAYDPRFLFTWPNSRISVMGGLQAARTLTDVRRNTALRRNELVEEESLNSYHDQILAKYEVEGHPYYASARLWDDGVIDPLSTRASLEAALLATGYHDSPLSSYGIFRM